MIEAIVSIIRRLRESVAQARYGWLPPESRPSAPAALALACASLVVVGLVLTLGCGPSDAVPGIPVAIEPDTSITITITPTTVTVTGHYPLVGSIAGGDEVIIVGSNFQAGAAVTFANVAAASVVVVSSRVIVARTPALGSTQVGSVAVSSGRSSATSPYSFQFVRAPVFIKDTTVGNPDGLVTVTVANAEFLASAAFRTAGINDLAIGNSSSFEVRLRGELFALPHAPAVFPGTISALDAAPSFVGTVDANADTFRIHVGDPTGVTWTPNADVALPNASKLRLLASGNCGLFVSAADTSNVAAYNLDLAGNATFNTSISGGLATAGSLAVGQGTNGYVLGMCPATAGSPYGEVRTCGSATPAIGKILAQIVSSDSVDVGGNAEINVYAFYSTNSALIYPRANTVATPFAWIESVFPPNNALLQSAMAISTVLAVETTSQALYAPAGSAVHPVALADVNRDGFIDILVGSGATTSRGATIVAYLGGRQTITDGSTILPFSNPVVIAGAGGTSSTPTLAGDPTLIEVNDFNLASATGINDFAVLIPSLARVQIFLNQ